MAEISSFSDEFANLDNWTTVLGGSGGATFSAAGGRLLLDVPQGVDNQVEILHTNDQYEFDESWTSIEFVTYGRPLAINQGIIVGAIDAGISSPQGLMINYNPNTAMFSVNEYYSVDAVTFPDPGVPFVIGFKVSAGTAEAGYSTDAGATWTSLLTWTWANPAGAPSAAGMIYFTGSDDGSADAFQWAFDNYNVYEPFAPTAGSILTEVTETAGGAWGVGPAYLRHSARHVHHTVLEYLREQLTTLKWIGPPETTPFGATPVDLSATHPPEWRQDQKLQAGKVAVTLGDELGSDLEELGGPLSSVEHPIFVDIYMDDESIALALALDVRDIFYGRIAGSRRWLPILDFSQSPPTEVPNWHLEFEDITRVRPDDATAWQVVKVTATTFFHEVVP